MKVNGLIAIVTGASSGIGAATAVRLAERGSTVIGVARREDRLAETIAACRQHNEACVGHGGDVAQRSFADELVDDALGRFGRVDILVNNAGISPPEDPVRHASSDAEAIMAVNFFAPIRLAGALLPGMVERGRGSIVNVTSVSGYVPAPGEPAYGASKAALSRWSHGLAIDLHGTGVHVGVLSPGPIDTEIWAHTGHDYNGKLYPASRVADAVVQMIERGTVHATVPRRFGAVSALYPLMSRPMRWGVRRYAAVDASRPNASSS